MVELIALIILIVSFLGMGTILVRKIPAIGKLPEPEAGMKDFVASRIQEVKNIPGVKDLSYEKYLQRLLSKIRILTLKTDHKTSGWLESLRQKNSKNNSKEDNYWEELKKAKKGK